jgi:hypothetical protein
MLLFIIGISTINSILSLSTHQVFALPLNNVIISHLSTNPSVVMIGNSIGIHAVIKNNSTHSITFNSGCGAAPLNAMFNKNVQIKPRQHCEIIFHVVIKPGEKVDLQAPPAAEKYIAISTGKTVANVIFHYIGGEINGKLTFDIVKK